MIGLPLNPFELPGMPFLGFFGLVAWLVHFVVNRLVKLREADARVPKLNLTDPYEIALLRGGENEALRLAALSLVDRGILTADGSSLSLRARPSAGSVRRPIEQALVAKFATPTEAHKMFSDPELKRVCLSYRNELTRHQLLATPSIQVARTPIVIPAMLALLAIAATKIHIAYSRGRTNVQFLVILAGLAVFFLAKIILRDRTGLGDRVLNDLRTLFSGLKERVMLIPKGGATNEAALLAAVFGIGPFSHVLFPYAQGLFPKATRTASYKSSCGSSCDSSCGSTCGASCGSSSGSSCGSSGCGGGGGGGGCGGCGS